jgi:hypothetical protein
VLAGLALYGRGYRLVDPADNGYRAIANGPCEGEEYTATPGMKGYMEYCEFVKPEGWAFTRVRKKA